MDITTLEEEWAGLVLPQFDEAEALRLGQALVEAAMLRRAPVVIDIRTPDRTLFHAALPGAAPLNDLWARRKSNLAFMFQAPSMLVTLRMRASGEDLARHGLPPEDYALSGGSVPIRVSGTGVVAAATVSGLPQEHDHALVVAALTGLVAGV
jgi:uncharacterized protein (UPF0303 family)